MHTVDVFPPLMGEKQFLVKYVSLSNPSHPSVETKEEHSECGLFRILHKDQKRNLMVSVYSGWKVNETKSDFRWVDCSDLSLSQRTNSNNRINLLSAKLSPNSLLFETDLFRLVECVQKKNIHHIECVDVDVDMDENRPHKNKETWWWRHAENFKIEVVSVTDFTLTNKTADPTFQMYWFLQKQELPSDLNVNAHPPLQLEFDSYSNSKANKTRHESDDDYIQYYHWKNGKKEEDEKEEGFLVDEDDYFTDNENYFSMIHFREKDINKEMNHTSETESLDALDTSSRNDRLYEIINVQTVQNKDAKKRKPNTNISCSKRNKFKKLLKDKETHRNFVKRTKKMQKQKLKQDTSLSVMNVNVNVNKTDTNTKTNADQERRMIQKDSEANWDRLLQSLGHDSIFLPNDDFDSNHESVTKDNVSDVLDVKAVYPNTDIVVSNPAEVDSEEMLSSTKWVIIIFCIIVFGVLFLFLIASICLRLAKN